MISRKAYRVSQFCEAYGIGRTKVHAEISCGRLKSYKVGRARMISFRAAEEWQKTYEVVGVKTRVGGGSCGE